MRLSVLSVLLAFAAARPEPEAAKAEQDVAAAREALAQERARLHVWQGRLAEARAGADAAEGAAKESQAEAARGAARGNRAVLARARASRVRVATLRLHAKDLEERADQEWDNARALNATLHGLEAQHFAPHPDMAESVRALRAAAFPAGGDDGAAAAVAEENATALREERLHAEEEVAALVHVQDTLGRQVASTEHRAWAMRAELARGGKPSPSNATLPDLTAELDSEVAKLENTTNQTSGQAQGVHVRHAAGATPPDTQALPAAAQAVAQLEERLAQAGAQRTAVEAEHEAHLANVRSMNATLSQLEERSRSLSATLATVA